MKTQLRFVFVVSVVGIAAAIAFAQATAKPEQVPISIRLSGPASLKAGSELSIDVTYSNVSDARAELSTVPEDFKLDVLDSKGTSVSETKKANENFNQPKSDSSGVRVGQGSYQGRLLEPHEVIHEHLVYRFDLSTLGKYTAQVTKLYDKAPVRSNVITITVVP